MIIWKEFDGKSTVIMENLSRDGGASWHGQELARTDGPSEQPYLMSSGSALVLVWRTDNEGVRVVPTLRRAAEYAEHAA